MEENNDYMYYTDLICTSEETTEKVRELNTSSLLERTKSKYNVQYNTFKDWCASKNVEQCSENVILDYISELSHKYKASTLWSVYSMLKATIFEKDNIDIGVFSKVNVLLKSKSVGYIAKKSRTFTADEVHTFLTTAPDEIYLMNKVVLIIGIAGACRIEELTNMTIDNVQNKDDILIIDIPNTKNYKHRTFTISNSRKLYRLSNSEENFVDIIGMCKKYFSLRPSHMTSRRLFIKYTKGTCQAQNVGHHTIGALPARIAEFLNLPNKEEYTGHCFRRTSAALRADSRTDQLTAKPNDITPSKNQSNEVFVNSNATASFGDHSIFGNAINNIAENLEFSPNVSRNNSTCSLNSEMVIKSEPQDNLVCEKGINESAEIIGTNFKQKINERDMTNQFNEVFMKSESIDSFGNHSIFGNAINNPEKCKEFNSNTSEHDSTCSLNPEVLIKSEMQDNISYEKDLDESADNLNPNIQQKADKRDKNWEWEEKMLLLEQVKKYVNVLENKSTNARSASNKKLTWQNIEKQFITNGYPRTADKIKSQWRRMVMKAKYTISLYKNYKKALEQKIEGRLPPREPSEVDWTIAELFPNDFKTDTSEIDFENKEDSCDPSILSSILQQDREVEIQANSSQCQSNYQQTDLTPSDTDKELRAEKNEGQLAEHKEMLQVQQQKRKRKKFMSEYQTRRLKLYEKKIKIEIRQEKELFNLRKRWEEKLYQLKYEKLKEMNVDKSRL